MIADCGAIIGKPYHFSECESCLVRACVRVEERSGKDVRECKRKRESGTVV